MKPILFFLTLFTLSSLAQSAPNQRAPQLIRRFQEFESGERVLFQGYLAVVLNSYMNQNQTKYRLVLQDMTVADGYTSDMLYKTAGCMEAGGLCVNAAVIVNETKEHATVIGVAVDEYAVKYTLRFQNGVIDTGFRREMLSLK